MDHDSSAFMQWLGEELRKLYEKDIHDFVSQKELVVEARRRLWNLSPSERGEVLNLLLASHRTRLIGNFKIRYDLRDQADVYEEIISTLEAYLGK